MTNLDLRKMTAADVIRQAIIISGKTQEQIEEEAGLRPGSLDQYASRRDHHWPSIINLPALSMAMGTDLLIRWQEEQYLDKCLAYEPTSMTPEELLKAIVEACGRLGDVSNEAQRALKDDDDVSRPEAMAIRREAMEAVVPLWRIINGMATRV